MKGTILFVLLHLIFFSTFAQRVDYKNFDFQKADSIASSLKGVKGYSIPELATALTANLHTDVEKIRAIYKWITENIEYDVVEYHQNVKVRDKYSIKRRRRYLKRNSKNISKKTLRKGKAICYGYSYLFKELTSSIGIASHLVGGYSRTRSSLIGRKTRPDHAWNIVFIDQQWYPVDVTWSSGYTNKKVTKFEYHFDDFYFLTKPESFIRDHYPQDPMWTMILDPVPLKEFFNMPAIIEGFDENKINRFKPESGIIRAGVDTTTQFFFTSNKDEGLKSVSFDFMTLTGFEFIEDMPSITLKLIKSDLGYYCNFQFSKAGRFKLLVSIDSNPSMLYDVYIR